MNAATATRTQHVPTRLSRITQFALAHPFGASVVAAWALLGSILVAMALEPESAHAAIPLVPIVIGSVVAAVGGGFVLGEAGGAIQDWLRDCVNAIISVSSSMVSSLVHSDALTKPFDGMFETVYPVVYSIHQSVVITLADVVLVVFLLVGLGKLVQDINRTESGVDLWRLVMLFVAFSFCKTIIDSSFELMVFVYEIVRALIQSVMEIGEAGGALSVTPVGEDVKNAGVLMLMLLVSALSMLVVSGACMIAVGATIVRGVKIYVMTCYAPIPLAFFVSDSSRPMATGFLKRYLATLFSGAILALLFMMFGALVGNMSMTSTAPDSFEHIVQWCCEMMFSLVGVCAFGWAVYKSGSWAQEFVGL